MNYDICIVGGAGHIGLPLSIAFADKGKKVIIYDLNEKSLNIIERGEMPFKEDGAEAILKRVINKTLFTSKKSDAISQSKYIIVTIGTPVDEHLNPKFHEMKHFFDGIIPFLKNDHIVILRSTVYPGLTEKIQRMLKKVYPEIEICFCPERIAEGKAMEELYSLPQIISGFNEKAIAEVGTLFNMLTKDILHISPVEAELAKLFTNSWRYIQFATANQFYMLAEGYGLNFYKIYEAMTYNYPRTKGFPKPGWAAGPCLFKDTMQISAFSKNNFFLGHSAMLVNEGLPNFIIEKLKTTNDLKEKNIGILGMAFKAESDDKRESLSYKLRRILEIESNAVLCSDVYIKSPNFVTESELIDRCDIIIIGAPHSKYKDLDFKGKQVIDIWNIIN
jgi:UDP-N-acetyl-D-mannosaminuronic acid dehydrogenase